MIIASFSSCPKSLQNISPRNNLIQHSVYRCFLVWCRLEDTKVLEVYKERSLHLHTYGCNLQFCHHQTQLFDRAHAAGTAISNKSCNLVVPLFEQKVDSVLERGWYSVVVFRCHEDKCVKGIDSLPPEFLV